jgi:multidrug efflux pump subunit AcrB
VGGVVGESDKANKALLAAALQLQSFSRMWMVVLTAPLGLIGVVPTRLVFQSPPGYVAILCIIALGGETMGGLTVATLLTIFFAQLSEETIES